MYGQQTVLSVDQRLEQDRGKQLVFVAEISVRMSPRSHRGTRAPFHYPAAEIKIFPLTFLLSSPVSSELHIGFHLSLKREKNYNSNISSR